jgi:NodT family efflux transporter outer membrane factor (OMF) lipoprotein
MNRICQIISFCLHRVVYLGLMLCLSVMTGCAVGPDFQAPQVQVPDAWYGPTTMPSKESAASAERNIAERWKVFQDPTLTSLVERAIEGNLNLKLAEARIRQARAARREALSDIGPTVNARGSFQRSSSMVTTSSGGGGPAGPGASQSKTEEIISDQYEAGFDAIWELDIFGGVRRGVEAADADLQATVETRRDVLVTLTAEVARNYIDLCAFQERTLTARRNLKAQQHSAELTRQRFQAGFVSSLDVANADAQVATTSAQIPLLEVSAQQAIYSLSVLLGREPAALMQELSVALEIPAVPPSVPVGVPSELLRRRPDIRRAEADIHAATARVGVATADLFPKVTLSGSIGYRASDLDSWFDRISRLWLLGPVVSWQIFDTGRIRSNIEVQKALEEQSVITYQQTVLAALQEVENALIASAKEQEHRKALAEAVAANQKAVELATELYTQGQTDFLNVLQAQRSLYVSEDALAQSTRTVSTNLIALCKALGGGWGS